MPSLGHFISFSLATEVVKGVNYFPSRSNDQFEKSCYRQRACKFSEIPLFILPIGVKLAYMQESLKTNEKQAQGTKKVVRMFSPQVVQA